jgi:FkbM family methyltransferase
VVCVEPSVKAVKILRANLNANGSPSNVEVITAALAGADGHIGMLTTGPAGADYFVVPTAKRSDLVSVTARSMRSVLLETDLKPTHIKMDIEGYELEVIEAATDILEQQLPIVYLELHGSFMRARGKNPGDVISALRRAGYRSFITGLGVIDDREMEAQQYNCRLVCLR